MLPISIGIGYIKIDNAKDIVIWLDSEPGASKRNMLKYNMKGHKIMLNAKTAFTPPGLFNNGLSRGYRATYPFLLCISS